eukprot:1889243-Rhodomonas_salina.2
MVELRMRFEATSMSVRHSWPQFATKPDVSPGHCTPMWHTLLVAIRNERRRKSQTSYTAAPCRTQQPRGAVSALHSIAARSGQCQRQQREGKDKAAKQAPVPGIAEQTGTRRLVSVCAITANRRVHTHQTAMEKEEKGL